MAVYKVKMLDGSWYLLGDGAGATAKIRALDGSWLVENQSGAEATVRQLAGTFGPRVPFGTGPEVFETGTYSYVVATSPTACVLQGEAGVEPTSEFHVAYGSSRAVSYRLKNDGDTERQDVLAFFSTSTFLTPHTLEGAPTPPVGYEVVWCDESGTSRAEGVVDVMSVDIAVDVVTGSGGLSAVAGSNIIIRQSPFQSYIGTLITGTTEHATNGPVGSDLFTFPTSTSIGTTFTDTISRNGTGSIGIHCGVDWAINATTFDLGGQPSVNVGRWLRVRGTGVTYKRYYKFVEATP